MVDQRALRRIAEEHGLKHDDRRPDVGQHHFLQFDREVKVWSHAYLDLTVRCEWTAKVFVVWSWAHVPTWRTIAFRYNLMCKPEDAERKFTDLCSVARGAFDSLEAVARDAYSDFINDPYGLALHWAKTGDILHGSRI